MKKRELLKVAGEHSAIRLRVKGLKALKKYAYWQRVRAFLQGKSKHELR